MEELEKPDEPEELRIYEQCFTRYRRWDPADIKEMGALRIRSQVYNSCDRRFVSEHVQWQLVLPNYSAHAMYFTRLTIHRVSSLSRSRSKKKMLPNKYRS